MGNQIQLRRGTASAWTTKNPILADGEEGHERDTGKRKIGDGATAWNSLAYATFGISTGGGGGPSNQKISATLTSDKMAYDPVDQAWLSGTETPTGTSIDIEIHAMFDVTGAGYGGVQVLWSQSVLSGNLFNGQIAVNNGVVSGAHRQRVMCSVAGDGEPEASGPSPARGTTGVGQSMDKIRLTGLTAGQPLYYQIVPVLLDTGNRLLNLGGTPTYMAISPSGNRGYVLDAASVIPINLGRTPDNWKDAPLPSVTAGFPIRAFVTSDGSKLWTSALAVGAIQVFDTKTFLITSSPSITGMAPYGMCQDPTGTITVDLATYGGAYVLSGTNVIFTFAPAFKKPAIGKLLDGPMAAAFPAGTVVTGFTDSQHITVSNDCTTAVTVLNVGTYGPLILDGIAYVCDQGTGHNKIQLFNVATGAAGAAYSLTSPYVPYTISVSPDGSKLAVHAKNSTSNYRLLILNAATGAILFDVDTGNNSGVLPDPAWEDDSQHVWVACFGTSKIRRLDATTGAFDTARDITFNQPNAIAITTTVDGDLFNTGKTLFVAGGNTSAHTWAYFEIDPLPVGAPPEYDGNAVYGALVGLVFGPEAFIYALTSSGYLATVRGGAIYCQPVGQALSHHLEVWMTGV